MSRFFLHLEFILDYASHLAFSLLKGFETSRSLSVDIPDTPLFLWRASLLSLDESLIPLKLSFRPTAASPNASKETFFLTGFSTYFTSFYFIYKGCFISFYVSYYEWIYFFKLYTKILILLNFQILLIFFWNHILLKSYL